MCDTRSAISRILSPLDIQFMPLGSPLSFSERAQGATYPPKNKVGVQPTGTFAIELPRRPSNTWAETSYNIYYDTPVPLKRQTAALNVSS
jgi:hypothetical protein